jgi:hypothetical protein
MLDWLKERGIAVAVVSFARPERLQPYQAMRQWPVPLFADPDFEAYRAFELKKLPWSKLFNGRALRKYWKLFWEGWKIQYSRGDDVTQGGGDFLVMPNGDVRYEFRSDDPADRPTLQTLQEQLTRALQSNTH